jgi:hypothetical protein
MSDPSPMPRAIARTLAGVVLAAATVLASAGAMAASAGAAGDDAALRDLSVQWMQAIAAKDRPTLERLMAPEYVLRGAGDPPADGVPRAEWIGNAIGKDWSDFHYDNMVVQLDGDRATVASKLRFRIAPIPFELDAGVVDTWARRDGRWQVTGRYLGESRFSARVEFVKGFLAALALLGAFALVRRWRRRRAR